MAELVFEEILSGQTKVRHRETKADYDFNRLLDGAPYARPATTSRSKCSPPWAATMN